MSSAAQLAIRSAEIARVLETEEDHRAFQRHMEDVLHGEAFRGSHRSGQFLRYILDQAINGHCDELKERVIGVELFGRSPSYDTGEDAIVRVTASDVRKRLLQHYGAYGNASEFRIGLPVGSYIPEIVRDPQVKVAAAEKRAEPLVPETLTTAVQPSLTDDRATASTVVHVPAAVLERSHLGEPGRRILIGLVCLNLILWGALWAWVSSRSAVRHNDALWTSLFDTTLPTELITSDPDVASIQGLTRQRITLSDYANQRYIPDPALAKPEIVTLAKDILRGNKAATVDTRVTASIAQFMGQSNSSRLIVQNARDLRVADLLKDGNFILLGSPGSNPWSLFYSDRLDFRFVYDQPSDQEVIENFHPRGSELPTYIPTARGFATGQSFAVVSYLKNPDHRGHILLMAGADAEGTEAAGDLVTNPAELSAAMKKCGVPSSNSIPGFQMLLRVSTMAGSPGHFDVIACHLIR